MLARAAKALVAAAARQIHLKQSQTTATKHNRPHIRVAKQVNPPRDNVRFRRQVNARRARSSARRPLCGCRRRGRAAAADNSRSYLQVEAGSLATLPRSQLQVGQVRDVLRPFRPLLEALQAVPELRVHKQKPIKCAER